MTTIYGWSRAGRALWVWAEARNRMGFGPLPRRVPRGTDGSARCRVQRLSRGLV